MIISYKNSSSPCGDDERASGVGDLVVETLQGGGGAERDSHLEDKEIIIRRGIEGQPPGEDKEIMICYVYSLLVHKAVEVRPLSHRTSYVQTVVSCQKQFARQLFQFILQI